ncbi:hypothetical protein V2S66_10315 [Streptomyces sp. V4-01]|uniref:Uncharacterized protein n=1 Tax=Actinacidiphila polyblastidii TaxID=3110430 RepID=A0ABU7P982_9ACTN|nr:hypothetical protein [Streptomyces sp. V4-01]
MLPHVPSPHDPHLRTMRRMFLAVVTGSFLFLIPWIGYLSTSLPTHREVDQWRLAWVGFDVMLIVALGVTALCAWRRLQIFIPWAIATAALLGCDAWFDIVLDWNTGDLTGSILTAVFAELPLAALLLFVARRMIRLTLIVAWYHAGRSGPVPPLSRLSLLVLTAQEKSARPQDAPEWQEPEKLEQQQEQLQEQQEPPRQGPEREGEDGAGPSGTETEQHDDQRRHPPHRRG